MSFLEKVLDHQLYFLLTPLGIVTFILCYTIWVCILLPGSWLSMLGGFIYGSVMGTIYVFIGAILGAILTFVLGRVVLKDWIQKRLDSFPKLQLIQNSISNEGLKLNILTRLSPVFPFGLLNLAYGLSKVKSKDYLIGLIAILPGTFVYCSIGSIAIEVSKINQSVENSQDFISFIVSLIGIIATVILVLIILRFAKDSLEKDIN